MSERIVLNTKVGGEVNFELDEVDGRGHRRKEKGLVISVHPYHVTVRMPGGLFRSVCLGGLVRFGYEDSFPQWKVPERILEGKRWKMKKANA